MQKYMHFLLPFLPFLFQIVSDLKLSGVYKTTQIQSDLLKKIVYAKSFEFSLYTLIFFPSRFIEFHFCQILLTNFLCIFHHKINKKMNLYTKKNQQNWSVTLLNMARLVCSLTKLVCYILRKRGENKILIFEKGKLTLFS